MLEGAPFRAKLLVERRPWTRDISLLLMSEDRRLVANKVVLEQREDGDACEPTFRMTPHDAQELFDQLWSCGLRPTNAGTVSGELTSTRLHLDDMRRIVFDHFGVGSKDA